jgi:hypothetical protein
MSSSRVGPNQTIERGQFRVEKSPTNLVPVEDKIQLPPTAFGGPLDRVTFFPQLDHVGVLDETREREPAIAKPDRS